MTLRQHPGTLSQTRPLTCCFPSLMALAVTVEPRRADPVPRAQGRPELAREADGSPTEPWQV